MYSQYYNYESVKFAACEFSWKTKTQKKDLKTKTPTLVPEAFIYSLLGNFATQTAFVIFVIGMKR